MDTKCQTRRCCLTIPSQPSRPGSPALPPEILCCIINISPRVGVNGPMLKLTFISFIHPAKSAAMKRILAHKNVHLKMPCDSHFAMQRVSHDPSPHTRLQNSCLRHQLRNLLILSGWRKSSRGRHLIIPHHQSPASERIENTFSSSK